MTIDLRVRQLGLAGFAACLVLTPAFGQHVKGNLQQNVNTALNLADSQIVNLDLSAIVLGEPFTIDMPIDGQLVPMDMKPHSVRSDDYQVLVPGPDGVLQSIDPGPEATYRGTVTDEPGASIAGGVTPEGLLAVVNRADATYWIQPVGAIAGANAGDHVIYLATDVLPTEGECGVLASEVASFAGDAGADGGIAGQGDCIEVAQLACDADFPYFQNYGTVSLTELRINVVINAINNQYEDEVGISHDVTTIIVRTSSAADPYSSNNASTLLNQFANQWNTVHAGIPRDVAHLFTDRELQGNTIGIATLGSVCIVGAAYGLVQSDYSNSFALSTNLSAHELGHNWSANHCSCTQHTMNPSNNTANQFHPTFSIPEIIAFRNSRVCLTEVCSLGNDDCADAAVVGNGNTDYSTEDATTDGPADTLCDANGSDQIDADVWFRWTAGCDQLVEVSVCTSTFDTRLAIYRDDCPTGIDQAIACNDDGCIGDRSVLTFGAQDGVDYLIRVGGSNGATGTGTLDISPFPCFPPPSNDNCGSASLLQDGDTAFANFAASTDGPSESCGDILNDVWYFYIASCDGEATFSVCDADFDAAMAVYGPPCPAGPSAIACSDDSCGDGPEITLAVSAGEVYRIRVGSSGEVGSGTLSAECVGGVDCPTDTNGDNVTDVQDLTAVILAWGSDDAAADVNGDGTVDVQDLTAVVLGWGPC